MVRVRFHLGQGEHHRQWQIRHADGRIEYADPAQVSVRMIGCRLRNQRGTADRIHGGAHKKVCAWVECDWAYTFKPGGDDEPCGTWVGFNPRVAPHWRDSYGHNLDGLSIPVVTSAGRELLASTW